MQVRCPHCRNPIEIVDDSPLEALECPSCGSSFSLVAATDTLSHHGHSGKTLGHFELVQQLGIGAFGSVWKARDTKLQRLVAVKIPRRGQVEESDAKEFLRDARAAAQLRHPNIVGVHEVGRENGTLYIVSDFIDGLTLSDWLTGYKPSAREAAELIATISEALHHAHEAGVVHRDLKPSNIMLDREGRPHLIDFGLAKREAAEVTMTQDGHVLGTPAYMSPEQAQGDSHLADRRSDIYSLGVILFELTTGERPFRGNARMLIHQVLRDEPPAPRKLNAAIPRDLETVCLKCLEKSPVRRFQSAKELAEELRRFLRNEPIHSRRINSLERTWRWARREPKTASLLAAVIVALAIGVLASSFFGFRAQNHASELFKAQGELQTALGEETRVKDDLAGALQDKGRALDETRRQLSRNHLERGVAELQHGQKSIGLLNLLKAFELASDRSVERAGALNLMAGWGDHFGQPLCQHAAGRVVVSPDARTVLALDASNSVRMWDFETGEPRGGPLVHDERVADAVFHPDGQTVLTIPFNIAAPFGSNTAFLWDVRSGNRIGDALQYEGAPSSAATFSSNGQTIMIVSGAPNLDLRAWLWDSASGKRRCGPISFQLVSGLDLRVVDSGLNLSADGQTLLTINNDGAIELWNANTGESRGNPLKYEQRVVSALFNADGKNVITVSEDSEVRLWDATTLEPVGKPMMHKGFHHVVVSARDGATIFTRGQSATSKFPTGLGRLWDAATGEPRGEEMQLEEFDENGLFSTDGQLLLTTSGNTRIGNTNSTSISGANAAMSKNQVTLWDVATGKRLGPPLRHMGGVDAATFSPDGKRVLTGSFDKTARLWDTETCQPWGEPMRHDATVSFVAFGPQQRFALTHSEDASTRLWNLENRDPVFLKPDRAFRDWAVSADGKTILASGQDGKDGTAQLWDATTGQACSELLRHDSVLAVAYTTEGPFALTSTDQVVSVWDVKSGTRRGAPLSVSLTYASLRSVVLSPDGHSIATVEGGNERFATLWDIDAGQIWCRLDHKDFISTLAFSRDGQIVATGGVDGTVQLWDVTTGQPRGPVLHHDAPVAAVAFSSNGDTIATGCVDQHARLWNRRTGERLGQEMHHGQGLRAVAFSPDGQSLLTEGRGLRVWDCNTCLLRGEPTRDERVNDVRFSSDGRTTLMRWGYFPAALGRREFSLPLADEPERIRVWVETLTGRYWDKNDVVQKLTTDEWLARRRRLEELGGPPDVAELKTRALSKAESSSEPDPTVARSPAIAADASPKRSPTVQAEERYKRGKDLLKKGSMDDALKALQEAIQLNPNLSAAHNTLGIVLQRKGDNEGAIAAHKKAVLLDPGNAGAHNELRHVLFTKGDWVGAAEAARAAIEHAPKSAVYRLYLGDILMRLGEVEVAIAAYGQAIELNDELPLVHHNLGVALQQKGELARARDAYQEAVRLNSSDTQARQRLAWLLATGPEEVRDGKSAIEHANAACELTQGKDPRCIAILAAAYAEAGQFEMAVEQQQKALSFEQYAREHGQQGRALLQLFEQQKPFRDPTNDSELPAPDSSDAGKDASR